MIHSERFLFIYQGTSGSYLVPPGRRIVVKAIYVSNFTASAIVVVANAAGVGFWRASVAGNSTASPTGQHVVVYAGESLGLVSESGPVNCLMCGFAFDDVQLRKPPAIQGQSPPQYTDAELEPR